MFRSDAEFMFFVVGSATVVSVLLGSLIGKWLSTRTLDEPPEHK